MNNWIRGIIIVVAAAVTLSIILQSWIPFLIIFCFPLIMLLVAGVMSAFVDRQKFNVMVINSSPERDSYRRYVEAEDNHKTLN